MTNEIAIDVQGVGKKYYIGHLQNESQTLLESITKVLATPLRRTRKLLKGQATGAAELDDEMWALRDITFQVKRGEVLGIIGRNGAGKSTLLKVLSQITAPTTGTARLRGRVGSLLEVGTGFHDELTGRENVFLNGSILGLTRQEIVTQFDEIVEFAGVKRFIDTPVKHYSSGMKVRLAFAVAAHLNTEILLTDEVLSVGDYAFQKKSLGKMQEVTGSGRTVVFVSHQLDMVREICDRVILLKDGQIEMIGETNHVINAYINSFDESLADENQSTFTCEIEPERPFQLLGGRVLDAQNQLAAEFDTFSPVIIEQEYIIRDTSHQGLILSIILFQNETPLFTSFDTDTQSALLDHRELGRYVVRTELPCPLLKEGSYRVELAIGIVKGRREMMHKVKNALYFHVISTPTHNFVSYTPNRPGKLVTQLHWEHRPVAAMREHHASTN